MTTNPPTPVFSQQRAHVFCKPIAAMDPENISLPECEAALATLFRHHTHYRLPAARTPKLSLTENGRVAIAIVSDTQWFRALPAFAITHELGQREDAFLNELFAAMPAEQRPKKGEEQSVASVNIVAKAIQTMVANHSYEFTVRRPDLTVDAVGRR